MMISTFSSVIRWKNPSSLSLSLYVCISLSILAMVSKFVTDLGAFGSGKVIGIK